MNRHLLVAISDNPRAIHGVRFVSSFFSQSCDLKLTLFAAFPQGPRVWEEEKSYETLTLSDDYARKYEQQFRQALDAAKAMLTAGGFDTNNIDIKCVPQTGSTVDDILNEGEKGLYDAVVLGKRGLMRLEQLVERSVTEEALKHKTTVPLWICRTPDEDRLGVLLCLDGSEACYRIADHAGFMLGMATHHPITLFQVVSGKTHSPDTETIFARARAILDENGVETERIECRTADNAKISQTILEMADKGGYAAIAMGRTGAGKGLLGRVFLGSASRQVMLGLRDSALWLCR
ncbi:MAG: universal stress protein [Desulfovibrionaceae bacterium]